MILCFIRILKTLDIKILNALVLIPLQSLSVEVINAGVVGFSTACGGANFTLVRLVRSSNSKLRRYFIFSI